MENKFSLEFSFTQDDVISFAKISGDNNPIHLDESYASGTPFKKRIIHGFLGASVFSRIFGTKYPGEGTIYLKQDLTFRAPMYVGETYKAIIDTIEVIPARARARFRTQILDKEGKIVIDGEALVQNALYKSH